MAATAGPAAEAPSPLSRRRLATAAAIAVLSMGWLRAADVVRRTKTVDDVPDLAIDLLHRMNWTQRVVDHLESRRSPSSRINGTAKHPLVLVPGIISCGLELWKPGECFGRGLFRQRLWGGLGMARAILRNVSCWLDHMSLDAETGLDKADHEVRAAEGYAGADYFAPGYWLWSKLLVEAAAVGYDRNLMHLACFDWRLSYANLERRDQYFTRLKSEIEILVKRDGVKAVLLGHSMGASVCMFFLSWVELNEPGWTEKHIHTFVSLGGSLLGAVAPLGAVLSGEMQATAQLGHVNELLDRYAPHLTRSEQRDVYRSLGGLGSLLPKGGDAVWGEDLVRLMFDENQRGESTPLGMDAIAPDLRRALGRHTGGYDLGASWPQARGPAGYPLLQATENPLVAALPRAPSLSVFCIYGVGIETERRYRYTRDGAPDDLSDLGVIDFRDDGGVDTGDGDGTVPLESLGVPCALWRDARFKPFNPAGATTIIREHRDDPDRFAPRGGPATSKHVEILGNFHVIFEILKIATGDDADVLEDNVVSEIKNVSAAISERLLAKLGPPPGRGLWRG
mmetsp:Transcript_28528/g.88281  ORF Transcript_28528/g.88281 Transcript_28528/m.88281 type:complete len:566 (-) Transcript_28528:14-1711(-)